MFLNTISVSERSLHRISREEIIKEVEKIIVSSEFVLKGRSCQLLQFLIDETLQGRGDQLKQYTIGRAVFGRDSDFNPDLDPMVRIQVGRLRRSLDLYYLTQGKDDPVRISIRKGSYVPIFVNFADLRSQPMAQRQTQNNEEILSSRGLSIGVFPFINLTGDPEKDYFVQGLTEELSQELTHYEDFRVITVRAIPDSKQQVSHKETSEKLFNADFVIEGTVRVSNQQVKISVKITDTRTNEQLWGEQYQREMTPDNLITVQEEIARQVIVTIASEYGIIPQRLARESRRKKSTELSVYESILRYYYYQSQQTPQAAQIAFEALQQAILKDPDCGTAVAMLASMYGTAYMLDRPGSETALTKMIELANKAIKLDPDNQLVRLVFAWTHFVLNHRESFFVEIEKTLALNPYSPMRLGAIGFFIALYGDWDRGKQLLDRAMESHIGYPRWYHGATTLYYYRIQNYEAAFQEAVKYDTPGLFWGPMLRTATLAQLGRSDMIKVNTDLLESLKPDFQEKARNLIERYAKEEKLVEHLLEGLKKAGLKIA